MPDTIEGDWNRLYTEFPEVYDAWTTIPHRPRPIDVIAERIPLRGTAVVDVGAGTGTSSFELAEYAASVVGVEPNDAMRAIAERNAPPSATNISFVRGSAAELPLPDASVDVVAAMTTDLWPPEQVVPAFVAEAFRVLRRGGIVFALNTPPGWYGGELRAHARGGSDYEDSVDRLFTEAGFNAYDFETVQDYGTVERAVETYGFIFGSDAIRRLRETRQSRISWLWRLHWLSCNDA